MRVILIGVALLGATACSTVVRGTKETAIFESTPPGATVTADRITKNDDNPVSCVTPCKLQLSRKRDFNVTYELDGYKPVTAKLSSLVTAGGGAGFLGNAVIGGGVGAIVDAGTGALYDLRPNPMVAELEPLDSPDPSIVLDVDADEQASGVDAEAVKEQAQEAADDAPQSTSDEILTDVEEAAESVEEAAEEAIDAGTEAVTGDAMEETPAMVKPESAPLEMAPIGDDSGEPGLTDQ